MPYNHARRRRDGSPHAAFRPGIESRPGSLCFRPTSPDCADHGERRRCLRSLRLMRGALSHGCLGYAEVRSSYSIRRQKSVHQHLRTRVNDFALKLANVNGTGSASANGLLMQAIFRMGIPVSGKNLFPSNIQGLPTWYEIRVNKDGHTARALDYDLMVAMNAQTYARDIAEVRPGGYVLYDSSWPLDRMLYREDVNFLPVPLAEMCNQNFRDPRERTLMKNIGYAGSLVAILDIDMPTVEELLGERFA